MVGMFRKLLQQIVCQLELTEIVSLLDTEDVCLVDNLDIHLFDAGNGGAVHYALAVVGAAPDNFPADIMRVFHLVREVIHYLLVQCIGVCECYP